jgi:hypothetical protein
MQAAPRERRAGEATPRSALDRTPPPQLHLHLQLQHCAAVEMDDRVKLVGVTGREGSVAARVVFPSH